MASGSVDHLEFLVEKIAITLDAMSSLMETIYRLDYRGFDTTDARGRLVTLHRELVAWRQTHDAMAALLIRCSQAKENPALWGFAPGSPLSGVHWAAPPH